MLAGGGVWPIRGTPLYSWSLRFRRCGATLVALRPRFPLLQGVRSRRYGFRVRVPDKAALHSLGELSSERLHRTWVVQPSHDEF